MSITFGCKCGQPLQVEPEHAGMQVQCPTCNAVVTAPAAGPTLAKRATRPAARRDDDDREPIAVRDDDRPSKRSGGRFDKMRDDEGEGRAYADRHMKAARRRLRDEEERDRNRNQRHGGVFGTEKWVLSGGVIGGLIAMLIAAVWFVLGIVLADRIFFYPPILFIIGLVGIIKGLMGGGED